jgi:16S rRNA processing protein RimM
MSQPAPADKPTRESKPADSPVNREPPAFLAVGLLRHAHGVKGEISMEVYTDFPERLRVGSEVYIGDSHKPLHITHKRNKDQLLLLTFEGYADCDQVNTLRNEVVYTRADKLPQLPEGQYYHHQLIGLRVTDESGAELGTLAEILETGANDVYIVRSPDRADLLLPAIESVIIQVDLEKGTIVSRPPEWES